MRKKKKRHEIDKHVVKTLFCSIGPADYAYYTYLRPWCMLFCEGGIFGGVHPMCG